MSKVYKSGVMFACLVVLAFPSIGGAYTTGEDNRVALQEVTSELQVCSAYYAVAAQCFNQQQPELSDRYEKSSHRLESLARRGKLSLGVSDSAFTTQSVILLSMLVSATHDTCTNLQMLLVHYANFCQRLERNVDARVKEWARCARNGQKDCGGPELP
jgi:hypothetical protein